MSHNQTLIHVSSITHYLSAVYQRNIDFFFLKSRTFQFLILHSHDTSAARRRKGKHYHRKLNSQTYHIHVGFG